MASSLGAITELGTQKALDKDPLPLRAAFEYTGCVRGPRQEALQMCDLEGKRRTPIRPETPIYKHVNQGQRTIPGGGTTRAAQAAIGGALAHGN